jgi:hypothetical protein
MILSINVCDNCGTQAEIKKGDDQIEFHFKSFSLASMRLDNSYSGNKLISCTFCGKDCLLDYLKENLNVNVPKKEKE